MKIRTRYALLTAGLILSTVAAVTATVIRAQRGVLESEANLRLEVLMDGVERIAQESLEAQDEFMLLGYVKFLLRDRPEVVSAAVTRRGHTAKLGAAASDESGRLHGRSRNAGSGQVDSGLLVLTRSAATRRPITYTVTSLPDPAAPGPDLSISSAGVSLTVPGNALVKISETRSPDTATVSLGFDRKRIAAEAERALKPLIRRTVAIGAGFAGLGLVATLVLAGHLTKPLEAFAAAAVLVGRGKLDARVPQAGKDEMGALGRTFNEMTRSLSELMQFRQDILHTLSHEINTPLGGLKGYLEMWREHRLPPEAQADALETMAAAVARMENSLSSALGLFAAEAGGRAGPRRLVWVDEIVDEALQVLAPVAGSKRINVQAPPPKAAECLYAHDELLRQVIMNLISNALKYTPEGGAVRLVLEGSAEEVRFLVADTGRGIAPEDLPHIFTRFYRAEDPSRRIPGTGLGLSIAHRAATAMGGRIEVASVVGQGTTFTVVLPKPRPAAAPAPGNMKEAS